MAYLPHTLVAFGGTLGEQSDTAQDEIWECTVRGYAPGGSNLPLADLETYLDQIEGPLVAWFANAAHNMANTARITFVKANNIGADGKYSDPGATHIRDLTPTIGGGVHSMPSFLSLRLSWTTAFKRGPGSRGGIYPPNFVGAFSGSAASQATVDAAVLAATTLLDVLHNTPTEDTIGFIPIIASKIGAAHHEIQGVRVGNVFDVQRRRKYAVPESYTAAAWSSGG